MSDVLLPGFGIQITQSLRNRLVSEAKRRAALSGLDPPSIGSMIRIVLEERLREIEAQSPSEQPAAQR